MYTHTVCAHTERHTLITEKSESPEAERWPLQTLTCVGETVKVLDPDVFLALESSHSLLHFLFNFLLTRSLSLPSGSSGDSLITREDGRRKRTGEWGVGGWGRGTCDVPTQGYLIPSVRGERLSCSVWLWQIKEAVQILARSLTLSSWVDLTHTHAHTHSVHTSAVALGITGEDVGGGAGNETVIDGA